MKILYNDDYMKISARDEWTRGDMVLLSFTGIGHGMGGIDVQRPEFFGAGKSFGNIIFISDRKRSWGNSLDFGRIFEVLEPHIKQRRVYSIGNSMGGFLSIVASNFLPIHSSLSFVPQFSVDPRVVPFERRWKEHTQKIRDFVIPNATNFINDETRYFIFSGGNGPDVNHARLFPHRSNVFHYLFEDMGHNVAARLKEDGDLQGSIEACFRGEKITTKARYRLISPVLPTN